MSFSAWVILVSVSHVGAYALAAYLLHLRERRRDRRTIDRRIALPPRSGYQPGERWRL